MTTDSGNIVWCCNTPGSPPGPPPGPGGVCNGTKVETVDNKGCENTTGADATNENCSKIFMELPEKSGTYRQCKFQGPEGADATCQPDSVVCTLSPGPPVPTPPDCSGTQVIGESCDITKIGPDLPCNQYYGIKDSKYYQCEENPEDQTRCSFLTTECKP